MEQVKLVIFDMDGLLFDTERTYYQAFQRAAMKLGSNLPFDTYLKVVGVTDEKGKEILGEIYGKDSPILQAFDLYQIEFAKILEEDGLVIKPGATRLLDTLDERGIKKCIASSSAPEVIERNIRLSGLHGRFDFYISGSEVKHGKPSPDIFLEALRRADESAENAMVLEDSFHGLLAAVNANIRCIIIPDLIQPNEEMRQKAYRIYKDLGEVADFIQCKK